MSPQALSHKEIHLKKVIHGKRKRKTNQTYFTVDIESSVSSSCFSLISIIPAFHSFEYTADSSLLLRHNAYSTEFVQLRYYFQSANNKLFQQSFYK